MGILEILLLIFIGLLFTAFAALIFSAMTLALGKFFPSFEVSGPDDWTFGQFYLRYLIIAAVFTFVTIPIGSLVLGVGAMAVAYKFVFDAGWLQAIVIGAIGGTIALVLFIILMFLILVPLGLMAGA